MRPCRASVAFKPLPGPWSSSRRARLFAGRGGWPSIDVEETDKEYRVTAELPGLEERDVERRMHTPSNARSEYPSMQVKRRVSRTKGRAAGSAGLSCRSTH